MSNIPLSEIAKNDKPLVTHYGEKEKIEKLAHHFREILSTLGLDTASPNIQDTPMRIASMYVKEFFWGLDEKKRPKYTLFPNTERYNGMLLQKSISFVSCCEHHFVPIKGIAHVAYLPQNHLIGLSKINRMVHFFARRPQLQERLTKQIAEELQSVLQNEDVAIAVEAAHTCVSARGVSDQNSRTQTSYFGGAFQKEHWKKQFLQAIYQTLHP